MFYSLWLKIFTITQNLILALNRLPQLLFEYVRLNGFMAGVENGAGWWGKRSPLLSASFNRV